jgi:hypothetical protein
MEKPGKEKWLHNRGYLAKLTYGRPTKNFTAPSFPSYVYPWRYLVVGGFSIKYFCEDRKLFSRSKRQASCLRTMIRKIRACLKRHYYGVVVNKERVREEQRDIKLLNSIERSEYFLKEHIDSKDGDTFFPQLLFDRKRYLLHNVSLLRVTIRI